MLWFLSVNTEWIFASKLSTNRTDRWDYRFSIPWVCGMGDSSLPEFPLWPIVCLKNLIFSAFPHCFSQNEHILTKTWVHVIYEYWWKMNLVTTSAMKSLSPLSLSLFSLSLSLSLSLFFLSFFYFFLLFFHFFFFFFFFFYIL